MDKMSLVKLHNLYINGTKDKAPIVIRTIHLCNTTNAVMNKLGIANRKIHTNTRMLKHLYDAKPAEEYEFLLRNIKTIVRYPDQIYANKAGKRGQFCFVKKIQNDKYFCSVDIVKEVVEEEVNDEINFIVTAFRIRRIGYLKDYKLLWDRKGGSPSS